jgi:hypothetical protein
MKAKHILITVLVMAAIAFGQEKNSNPSPARLNHTYQLQFTFTELEDGKKINTRSYMVRTVGSERFAVREGARVPVSGKDNQVTYIDIGLNLTGKMNDFSDMVFTGNIEMSGLVSENEQSRMAPNGPPAMRNLSYALGSGLVEGKSTRVLDVDQPDGKRRLQIDLVVITPQS